MNSIVCPKAVALKAVDDSIPAGTCLTLSLRLERDGDTGTDAEIRFALTRTANQSAARLIARRRKGAIAALFFTVLVTLNLRHRVSGHCPLIVISYAGIVSRISIIAPKNAIAPR